MPNRLLKPVNYRAFLVEPDGGSRSVRTMRRLYHKRRALRAWRLPLIDECPRSTLEPARGLPDSTRFTGTHPENITSDIMGSAILRAPTVSAAKLRRHTVGGIRQHFQRSGVRAAHGPRSAGSRGRGSPRVPSVGVHRLNCSGVDLVRLWVRSQQSFTHFMIWGHRGPSPPG